jgi:hypothetical protein
MHKGVRSDVHARFVADVKRVDKRQAAEDIAQRRALARATARKKKETAADDWRRKRTPIVLKRLRRAA